MKHVATLMRKRLLTVQGPLQFIAGYIAFTSPPPKPVEEEEGQTLDVLLMYDFLCTPEIEGAIAESIRQLSRVQPWTRLVFITSGEMDGLMRSRYTTSIRRLHEILGEDRFDEIYLARDHIGQGSPLLMNAYPNAIKRTYGDSFGLVGQREMMKAFDPSRGPRHWIGQGRTLLRRALLGGPRKIPFDEAVLTLPMDQSGGYFFATPLRVPTREHAVDCVERIYAVMPALTNHCESLRQQGSKHGDHLYLLSNFTASAIASMDQEIALYVELIEANSAAGSTAYIKPHPRSSHEVLHAVVKRVSDRCRVVVLDDVTFGRIPIELWMALVQHCAVVAVFSTSATNLKYLYGKDVCMPLNEQRIRKYVEPARVEYVSKGDRMIRESVSNLRDWDGQSVLWASA